MVVYGILHFVYADFVANLVPAWMPWHFFWTYFVATALFAASAAVVTRRLDYLAATLLGVMILLFVLMIHTSLLFVGSSAIPPGSMYGDRGGRLNNCFKDLGLSGAAFVLAGTRSRRGRGVLIFGRWILALSISAFGILHALYPAFAPGVPPMFEDISFPLPGHIFWVYLTGVVFLAGGISIGIEREERLAATTVAIVIIAFDLLVWGPRFPSHPSDLWGNWLKDLGMAGGALLAAATAQSPIPSGAEDRAVVRTSSHGAAAFSG